MTQHDLSAWTHAHRFDAGNPAAERGTRAVLWITLAAMVVEIAAGLAFNSMALLADGWHMSSHALAIGLSAFAYAAARRYAADARFAFGTWKIEILGGYTSAILLLVVAALMVTGSVERLLAPQPIQYREALAVAALGLLVNLVCAVILGRAHDHHHGHAHGHDHTHGTDLNLRSAYLHVVVDALTSVLAIAALAGGWLWGWGWLDPVMGIVGAALVAIWARRLLVDSGKVLLDREMDHPVVAEIREAVEAGTAAAGTHLADLHVWRVGRDAYACALSLVTHDRALTPDAVRAQLAIHEEIVHLTIEIHQCELRGCR
jgi:cation diffusion facilitator family transporter